MPAAHQKPASVKFARLLLPVYFVAMKLIGRKIRPIATDWVVNGIDDLGSRSDFLDRVVNLVLPTIPDDERRDEDEVHANFDKVRPRVLGALLNGVSEALRNHPTVTLDSKPRMADFAVWSVAAEPALGWEPGKFLAALAVGNYSPHTL